MEELEKSTPHSSDLTEEQLQQIRINILGSLRGMTVVAVDGERIRNGIDIDFTTGGNPSRYKFVPSDELWIESILEPADFAASLLHEFVECTAMRTTGKDYDAAHETANGVERAFRAQLVEGSIAIPTYDVILPELKRWIYYQQRTKR